MAEHVEVDGAGLEDLLEPVLTELSEVLDGERRAVAAIDGAALTELAERKESCVERLAETLGRCRDAAGAELVLPRELEKRVIELRARAQANAALLLDAVDAIARILGLSGEGETYDARARVHSRHRHFSGKAA